MLPTLERQNYGYLPVFGSIENRTNSDIFHLSHTFSYVLYISYIHFVHPPFYSGYAPIIIYKKSHN